MKNAKREVVERLVPFNYAELEFLVGLTRDCIDAIPGNAPAQSARALVRRVRDKIERAQRARYGR